MPLDEKTLKYLRANMHRLTPRQKEEVLGLIEEWETRQAIKKAKITLLDFVKFIEPAYKIGAHHKKLAALLEDLANGVKHRIAVNIAPRSGKSPRSEGYDGVPHGGFGGGFWSKSAKFDCK